MLRVRGVAALLIVLFFSGGGSAETHKRTQINYRNPIAPDAGITIDTKRNLILTLDVATEYYNCDQFVHCVSSTKFIFAYPGHCDPKSSWNFEGVEFRVGVASQPLQIFGRTIDDYCLIEAFDPRSSESLIFGVSDRHGLLVIGIPGSDAILSDTLQADWTRATRKKD